MARAESSTTFGSEDEDQILDRIDVESMARAESSTTFGARA